MTWEELEEKHKAEWQEYTRSYDKTAASLREEKGQLLRAFSFMGSKMPKSIERLMEQRRKEFHKEWGIDGWRGKSLFAAQQKEIKIFFERERVKKNLGISLNKKNEKDNGR